MSETVTMNLKHTARLLNEGFLGMETVEMLQASGYILNCHDGKVVDIVLETE